MNKNIKKPKIKQIRRSKTKTKKKKKKKTNIIKRII